VGSAMSPKFRLELKLNQTSNKKVHPTMKQIITLIAIVGAIAAIPASAATPEQEKAFVNSYRKALEAGDEKALNAFLSTDGAEADTVEFFKMMQTPEPGAKIVSVELVKPSPEEEAKFNKPMMMPDGKSYKMPIKPFKQLVVKMETKDASGSSSSTSKSPVAEKNGKLVIPVPVPVK
jgi:hypothetical protein